MSLLIGENDYFERNYMQEFRKLTSKFGEFIQYDYDRAGVDLGLHLTEPTTQPKVAETVSNIKIWFQLKGILSTTLTIEEFNKSTEVTRQLNIEHIKFWYASPEAVYLTVYVECANLFITEDIRDIVDRMYPYINILNPATFGDQKTVTLKLDKNAILNEERLRNMTKHRSLRIDGPSFRGRPLGHRLDPLRCTLAKMEPSTFSNLVNRLLKEHGYKVEGIIDTKNLFPDSSEDIAELSYGTLHYTYEWVAQITTQYAPDQDEEDNFIIEGEPNFAQGKCAVLIHSAKSTYPEFEALKNIIQEIHAKNIEHLLVFVNAEVYMDDPEYIGTFSCAQRETDIWLGCIPQGLGEISFSLLIATLVYLDFRDKVSFKTTNYLWE
jgi:hypothetical protein